MDPLTIGLMVGSTLLGGIGNSEDKRRQAAQNNLNIERTSNILRSALIDENELSLMLMNTERLFNNRLTGALNTSAIKSRGYANAEVVGAAIVGSMEGQKLSSMDNIRNTVLGRNTQIQGQLAELSLKEQDQGGVSDFISGAFGGAQVGLQAGNFISNMGLLDTLKNKTTKGLTDFPETLTDFFGKAKWGNA